MKTLNKVIFSLAFLLIIGLNFAISTPSKAVNMPVEPIYNTECHFDSQGWLTGFDCTNDGDKECGGCPSSAPVED